MTAAPTGKDARVRFPGVRPLKPLLSREAERQLSARQLELLDELEEKFLREGLADLTMAEIAALLGWGLSPVPTLTASTGCVVFRHCAPLRSGKPDRQRILCAPTHFSHRSGRVS